MTANRYYADRFPVGDILLWTVLDRSTRRLIDGGPAYEEEIAGGAAVFGTREEARRAAQVLNATAA